MALVRNHLQRAFCGFSKSFFEKSSHPTFDFVKIQHLSTPWVMQTSSYSRYVSSPPIDLVEKLVSEYDFVENPPEWKYVERVLPLQTVPKPPEKGEFHSGWKPQNPTLHEKLPYFVKRTKNHMVPVFLKLGDRNGSRKNTVISHVYGDIWTLSEDIENHLKSKHDRTFAVQVNEFAGNIKIRGDFVLDTKEYLLSVGL